jgi:hypothetical protein
MADESVPFDDVDEAVTWIADSGLFIACGRQQNNKYTALERFARRNDITFVIPQRVYDELGGAPDRSTPGQTPINSAIDAGWVTVGDEPDYADSTVSRVMDDVRSYIATSSNRDESDWTDCTTPTETRLHLATLTDQHRSLRLGVLGASQGRRESG